jgi:Holliday junction resolvasome RuvABC endonuclease subunit
VKLCLPVYAHGPEVQHADGKGLVVEGDSVGLVEALDRLHSIDLSKPSAAPKHAPTDPVVILGIDPGPTSCGWAIVETRGGGGGVPSTCRFVAGGKREPAVDLLWPMMRSTHVVAIERPRGYGAGDGQAVRMGPLMDTSYVAGMCFALAWMEDRQVIEMRAADWRRMICGKGAASDAAVKTSVEKLVAGMPKRSNTHLRDAVGIALAAAWSRQRMAG